LFRGCEGEFPIREEDEEGIIGPTFTSTDFKVVDPLLSIASMLKT
jgi:hypothetical protein